MYIVTWLDAQTILTTEKPVRPYKKYLVVKETVAIEVFKDKDVVIAKTERTVGDSSEADYTYIPKSLIISVIEYDKPNKQRKIKRVETKSRKSG